MPKRLKIESSQTMNQASLSWNVSRLTLSPHMGQVVALSLMLAVAVGYAVGFAALWQLSFSHWLVFSGFRLCALLFAPRRFWPALVVGEFVPTAYNSLQNASDYGWLWAAVAGVPPIVLAIPVIHWYRQRKKIFRHSGVVEMAALVQCMLLISVIWTARNLTTMAITRLPANEMPIEWVDLAARWIIGNYLGVLTLVPIAAWVRERAGVAPGGTLLSTLRTSRVLRDGMFALAPSLVILVLVILVSSNTSIQHIARVSMFLPVVWLAVRHGWPGAAIGGAAASVAVIAAMPAWKDPSTLQAEVLVAFATTTMLLLGAQISLQMDRQYQEREERKLSQAAARRSLHVGEIQLRRLSALINDTREFVKLNHRHLIAQLEHVMPAMAEHPYVRQVAATQDRLQRLAEGLYPAVWRHRGLPAVLREGTLARALMDLDVHYIFELKGRGLHGLSTDVHITLYRLACEAVVLLCTDARVSAIRLRIRGGMHDGHRWVMLMVESRLEGERDSELYFEELQRRLATSGLGLEAIQLRAHAFEGWARKRPTLMGRRVSVLLRDPEL